MCPGAYDRRMRTPADRFIDHLAEAVRFETVSHDHAAADPDALADLHSFLQTTYPHVWSTLEVEAVAEHALLLTWHGAEDDAPGILLAAHQDVVPIEAPGSWDHPPFSGIRDGTHLYGRGVMDDKGPLIAILESVEQLIVDGFRPTAPVTLAFGHDEERMGADGAAAMAEQLDRRGRRVRLVLDEGGSITEGMLPGMVVPVAVVAVGEKGYADIELSAGGEPGHASTPPTTTAVGRVAKAVAAIESTPMPARLDIAAMLFEAIGPAARRGLGPLFGALPKLGRITTRALQARPTTNAMIRTTITPTIIEGGSKANVLPASARAVANSRILPGDTVADVVEHVRRVTKGEVDVRVLSGHDPPRISDPESEEFGLVATTISEVFPDVVVAPFVVMVATDARFYTGIADQVLRFQPFRLTEDEFRGIHGPNERMRLSDAAPALRFYRRLIERFCG